jgi:hypothetical protein
MKLIKIGIIYTVSCQNVKLGRKEGSRMCKRRNLCGGLP